MPLRLPTRKTRIALLSADAAFGQAARAALGGSAGTTVTLVPHGPAAAGDLVAADAPDVILVDVAGGEAADLQALQQLVATLDGRGPVIVIAQALGEAMARQLLQLRVADVLVKPVPPSDLVRACQRALQASTGASRAEAQIVSFLPASGGVGVTTLAIQAALLLLRGSGPGPSATCLVDLDFQQGACADYLDVEPRLDLNEIEPRPERLDAQLLEVMLSHHASGLAVICAPKRPAEMRSFDPAVVTGLLDLVSLRFDHVVLDMPRTWFPWTDSVLVGSNKAFVVTEATVPGLRHANALVGAIKQRLGETADPRVIVNRFEQRLFASGLRRADIDQALGGALAGTIPNNYRLVREAIDRGVPLDEVKARNDVTAELRKLVLPQAPKRRRIAGAGARGWRPFRAGSAA